jgi:membrane associated rhomboid family serine protease
MDTEHEGAGEHSQPGRLSDDSLGLLSRVSPWRTTITVIGVCTAFFALELYLVLTHPAITDIWSAANAIAWVLSPTVRFLTAPFLHGSVSHFAANMVMFLGLGYYLEPRLEWRSYAALVVVGGYIDGVVRLGAEPSIGISGGAFAVATFFGLTVIRRQGARGLLDSFEMGKGTGQFLEAVFGIGGVLALLLAISQFTGIVPVGTRTNTLAHLLGAGVGTIGFASRTCYQFWERGRLNHPFG